MAFLSNVAGSSSNASATFFEMAMSYYGSLSLYPAFLHVVQTIRGNYPGSRVAYQVHSASLEVFAMLRFLGESYFLSQHSASAFEMLYSLKRANTRGSSRWSHDKNPPLMDRRQRIASLCELVVLPYMCAKLDEIFERVKSRKPPDEANAERATESEATRFPRHILKQMSIWLQAVFLKVYPTFRKCIAILQAGYQLSFALNRSRFFSPWHNLFGYTTVRAIFFPSVDPLAVESGKSTFKKKPIAQRLSAWSQAGAYYAVVSGILVFKFFEWWYSHPVQSTTQESSESVLSPPPPTQAGRHEDRLIPVLPPSTDAYCSLCQAVCTNMAASPSGYIYCYPCIFAYIKQYGASPQTGVPCAVDEIRKIWLT